MYFFLSSDSNYFALSAPTLEELVRPAMKDEFEGEKADWFPVTSPPDLAKFQSRTPGLFKEEFRGTEMVCLNAKTYVVYDSDGDKTKFSCKGAQKKFVTDPKTIYKKVLDTKTPASTTNRSFRKKDNTMWTYTLDKKAFTYEYWKREILDDGVSTVPLRI